MLVLARREGQGISIGDQIKVVVIGIKGAQVKIGVKAPGDVAVHRDEVYARIAEQNRSATLPSDEAVDGLREPEGLVRFETTRFGTVEVTADKILHFKSGLLGFESLRRFTLLATPKGGAFRWMQSVDDPLVALLVCEARALDPNFKPKLAPEDLDELGFGPDTPRGPENELVLVTVTIPPGQPEAKRANFQGPIIVNADRRTGKQIVIVPEREVPGVAPTRVSGLVTFTVGGAPPPPPAPPRAAPAPVPVPPPASAAPPAAAPRPLGAAPPAPADGPDRAAPERLGVRRIVPGPRPLEPTAARRDADPALATARASGTSNRSR